jgi:hypothetical protein
LIRLRITFSEGFFERPLLSGSSLLSLIRLRIVLLDKAAYSFVFCLIRLRIVLLDKAAYRPAKTLAIRASQALARFFF